MSAFIALSRVKKIRAATPFNLPLWVITPRGGIYINLAMLVATVGAYTTATYGVTHGGWSTLWHFLWFGFAYILLIRQIFRGDIVCALILPAATVLCTIWLAVNW